jgi:hypothetical protein
MAADEPVLLEPPAPPLLEPPAPLLPPLLEPPPLPLSLEPAAPPLPPFPDEVSELEPLDAPASASASAAPGSGKSIPEFVTGSLGYAVAVRRALFRDPARVFGLAL